MSLGSNQTVREIESVAGTQTGPAGILISSFFCCGFRKARCPKSPLEFRRVLTLRICGDMKIKAIGVLALSLTPSLFAAPIIKAQDLSKYREFSLGTNLADVLKRTDKKLSDVNTTHGAPTLFQEFTWWPPRLPGTSYRSDSVEQVLFSFFNGELYKVSVRYDQISTEGLTAEDMMKSISVKYGPPTSVAPEPAVTLSVGYDAQQRPIASWEDSQYSFNLVRDSFTDRFGLVIYSKRVNTEAALALEEAARIEKQEAPAREAERQKKQTDDRELLRQKNQKSFRP